MYVFWHYTNTLILTTLLWKGKPFPANVLLPASSFLPGFTGSEMTLHIANCCLNANKCADTSWQTEDGRLYCIFVHYPKWLHFTCKPHLTASETSWIDWYALKDFNFSFIGLKNNTFVLPLPFPWQFLGVQHGGNITRYIGRDQFISNTAPLFS